MVRRLAQSVRVDFLDDASSIRNHHSPTRGRGRGDVLLVKGRCARAALPIKRIGGHFVSLLAFVHDIRHKGVTILVKLLLLARIGARLQQLHQNRRHYGLFVARQLRPANHALAHFGFHRLGGRSRRIAPPLKRVELHFHVLVLRHSIVDVIALHVLLAFVFHEPAIQVVFLRPHFATVAIILANHRRRIER